MADGENIEGGQNLVEGQEVLEGQTDKQRMEWLNKEIFGKTQELEALNIDTISSVQFEVIERTISSYSAEWKRLYDENNPDNKEQLDQIKLNLDKLGEIKNRINREISNQTNAALNQLSNETVASQNQDEQNQSEQNQENPEQNEPEKKGIRGWWKGLTDGQRRGIRIAGGVGAGGLLFGLLRRRRRKNKENITAVTTPTTGLSRAEARRQRIEARRAKPFWDRPLGKAIKWTAIGGGIYYLVHKLVTGKNNPLDLKQDIPVNSSERVYNNYRELMEKDPEKYNEYENIGTNINSMYDTIWDTERNYFGDDSQIVMGEIGNRVEESKLEKAEGYEHMEAKGLVPYSLDNFYGNVNEMLSHKGVNKYIRAKNIEQYKQKIIDFGADWFNEVMVPYLSSFASFATFGFVSSDSAQDKMNKYFQNMSEHAEERQAELDLFFRQYMKVLTYMADKKNALALKEARKIISAKGEYDGTAWPSDEDEQRDLLLEAINDKDWVEQNLKGTRYGAFMSSNIIGACRILEDEDLDDSEPTDELQEMIDDADAQTKKIIGGSFDNNAFTVAEKKLSNGGKLDSSEISGLQKVADNVVEDLGDTTEKSWMFETFDYAFEALGLDEQAKQIMLKHSGLDECFTTMVGEIKKMRTEVITNPTKENVENLKNLVGEYTSMKKELAVAIYGMKEAEENKDVLDYVKQYGGALCTFFGHFWKSLKKLRKLDAGVGDIFNVFAGLTVSGGMLCFVGNASQRPLVKRVGRQAMNTGLLPVTLARLGLGRTGWGPAVASRINVIGSVDVGRAQNLLERGILDGTLNPRQVKRIVKKNPGMKYGALNAEASPETVYDAVVKKMFGDRLTDDEITLFRKYNRKVKNLVHYDKSGIVNGGLRGGYKNLEVVGKNTVFKELKEFDDIMKNMPKGPQKKYMQLLLKECGETGDMVGDLKFLNGISDYKIFERIGKDDLKYLKKIKLSELRVLGEKKLLEYGLREQGVSDLLRGVPRLQQQGEKIVSQISKEFDDRIAKEIGKIERTYGSLKEGSMEWNLVKRLEAFRAAEHSEEEMRTFMKMMKKGFDVRCLDQFDVIFKLDGMMLLDKQMRNVGPELKKLLSNGEYTKFRNILLDADNAAYFKKMGVVIDEADPKCVLKSLNKVFKFKKGGCEVGEVAIKSIVKVISKIAKIV